MPAIMQQNIFLLILALIPLIKGQVANLGKCPEVEPMQNFRKNDFSGRWYTVQSFPNMFTKHFKCIYGDFSFPEDGKFHQTFHIIKTSDNTEVVVNVLATFVKGDDIPQFDFDVMENVGEVHIPLTIIATDYVNYSAFWGCEERDNYSYSTLWILTRNRNLSQEILDEALEVYKKDGLETDSLEKIDQANCPN